MVSNAGEDVAKVSFGIDGIQLAGLDQGIDGLDLPGKSGGTSGSIIATGGLYDDQAETRIYG